ncbi:MAG: glycoside hydrolase family 3 C-terminal domain-containing protein [Ilumatobacteraceae bacterium]
MSSPPRSTPRPGDETPFDAAARRVVAGADPVGEAATIVAAMTDEERLGCLDGDTPFWPGLVDLTSGGYNEHGWPAARVERLGVPGIEFADGPRGCVIGNATAFPVPMARGASFDPALEEEIGAAIGAELRASGATLTGAICMNLLRHPAWGRAQETYGEDPLHVGEMAAAATRGLQRHVLACMKHLALNSMENARFQVDVRVGERALHEVYLPHFRRVAREGVAAAMSAYNSVNGSWCGENRELLTSILREEWGWDGFVISDFVFGVRDAVASVAAGLDVEMPFRQRRAMALPDALADGTLDRDDVDRAATRVVATLLRFRHHVHGGLDGVADPPASVVASPAHRELARRASAASMVLLGNDGDLLPLDPSEPGRIVVLGPLADVANLGDGGSSDVHPPTVITPLEGIRSAFGRAEVVHHHGRDADGTIADVGALVDGVTTVIVVVGYTKLDEGEYLDDVGTAPLVADLFPPIDHPQLGLHRGDGPVPADGAALDAAAGPGGSAMAPGGDRTSLRLAPADESLIAAAAAAHDRVIVVVMAGSAVVAPWADTVGAVLLLWYPGMEGGAALGDVLSGWSEPGGRLPFAVPHDEADLVPFDRDAATVTYDLLHGQWWLDHCDVEPHFAFGAGQGYTTWDVVTASVSPAPDDPSGVTAHVTIDVRNTGARDGSTVLFVFAGVPDSDVVRPPRRLIGFRRVHERAGGSARVVVPVDLAHLDVRLDGRWSREPGSYHLEVCRRAGDPAAVHLDVTVA